MVAYREAIMRHSTSSFSYLAWDGALEEVSQLARWLDGQPMRAGTSAARTDDSLRDLMRQLVQAPDDTAQSSRQLLQTATYLAPTTAFAHFGAGPHRLQR